jgi:hypothetical protein
VLGHDRALLEGGDRLVDQRDDRRHVGLGMPGPQRDERLPALGVQRADDEVGLAAEARVDPRLDARGVRLREQVDLQGGVHRGHRALLSDDGRLVRGLGPQDADPRVAVDPGVELGAAEQERRDDLGVGVERAGPVELEHAVAEHLGPQPQAPARREPVQRRVGNRADTHLQRRTVGHALGHPRTDRRDTSSSGRRGGDASGSSTSTA